MSHRPRVRWVGSGVRWGGNGVRHERNRVFRERNVVMEEENPVRWGRNHVLEGENDVLWRRNDVTEPRNHVTEARNHVRCGRNHVRCGGNAVRGRETWECVNEWERDINEKNLRQDVPAFVAETPRRDAGGCGRCISLFHSGTASAFLARQCPQSRPSQNTAASF